MHRGLLLLLGWSQFEVLAKLAQVVHITPHDNRALGLWRRRLLHLLLLLGRSSSTGLVDVRRWHSNVVCWHDDLLGLDLLLLLLLIVGHHWRRWHVSGMMRMSHVHRRFAHGLHLATGDTTSLLWSQRWWWFGVVWRRARILPHGTLRQRLSITIYIHATAATAAAVGHFSPTIAIHLVHIRVTIYNRRLAMLLLLLLLLMGLLMLNVATVRRLIRVHRAVLGCATTVLLIAWRNLLLLLLRRHRHVLIAVVLVWRSLWAQWLLLRLLLRRKRLLLLRLLLLWRLLLWKRSSTVVGQRRWSASGRKFSGVTLALGRDNVFCVRWHYCALIIHTIGVLC